MVELEAERVEEKVGVFLGAVVTTVKYPCIAGQLDVFGVIFLVKTDHLRHDTLERS